jgi:hypothetical protein
VKKIPKGNELTKEVFKSLKRAPINFIETSKAAIFSKAMWMTASATVYRERRSETQRRLYETFTEMLRMNLQKR